MTRGKTSNLLWSDKIISWRLCWQTMQYKWIFWNGGVTNSFAIMGEV